MDDLLLDTNPHPTYILHLQTCLFCISPSRHQRDAFYLSTQKLALLQIHNLFFVGLTLDPQHPI